MFEEGVVEGEENDIREPTFMVFMGMGGKDPIDFGNAFVPEGGKNGGAAIQKIGAVIHGNHITATLSHEGKWAGVSDHVKDDILAHILRGLAVIWGSYLCKDRK
jgi:hypothetical protein